ncbi:WD40-repeat-containing domain protein [Trichoderma compactum]
MTKEAVAFSHDSQFIISGSSDAALRVWDATTGRALKSLIGHNATIYAVAFSHNSYLMISASRDGVVIVWNDDKQTHRIIEPNSASCSRLTFSEISVDVCHFCTASADGDVRIWSTKKGQHQQVSRGHEALVSSLAISPTLSTFIASGSLNETIKLWEVGTRICKQTIGSIGAAVRAFAFSQDSNFVVCGLSDSTIKIWDKWLAF